MKTAAPAILKKLTQAMTVPEMAMGKSSLICEKVNIPKLEKKPMKNKMTAYQKSFWISTAPTRGRRVSAYKLVPQRATLFVDREILSDIIPDRK